MKVAQTLGGIFLAGVLVLAAWSGLAGEGRLFADTSWDALREFGSWFRARTQSLGTGMFAGDEIRSTLAALAVFVAGVVFVPPVRQGRGQVALGVACAALGFLLYNGGLR